jgi:uncharacterized protein (DUF488 family)
MRPRPRNLRAGRDVLLSTAGLDVTRPPGCLPTLWTVGHATRALSELLGLLAEHGIERLVDVRTIPRSRHNPQFNRDTFPEALAAAGVAYVHMAGLGGLRRARPDSTNTGWRNAGFRGFADHMETAEFEQSLTALVRLAVERPTAIMCAETVPWRCHRSLIADALTARDVRVVHVLGPRHASEHVLTAWARVDGAHVSYAAPDSTPKLL